MPEILGLKTLKSHPPVSSQTSLWVTSTGYFSSPSLLLPPAFLRMSALPDFSNVCGYPFYLECGFCYATSILFGGQSHPLWSACQLHGKSFSYASCTAGCKLCWGRSYVWVFEKLLNQGVFLQYLVRSGHLFL